jgi:hypothetical protein
MVLILRGKRLGFSLKEISDYLSLYDADPQHVAQNERLLKLVTLRIGKLEQQRAAVEEMLAELYEYKRHAEAKLAHKAAGTAAGAATAGGASSTATADTADASATAKPVTQSAARTETSVVGPSRTRPRR